MMEHDTLHEIGDMTSVLVVLGSVAEILPPIAAGLAIVWTMIRIYEWARVRIFHQKQDNAIK